MPGLRQVMTGAPKLLMYHLYDFFKHILPILLLTIFLYINSLFKPKFILKEMYHAMCDKPVSFQYSLK